MSVGDAMSHLMKFLFLHIYIRLEWHKPSDIQKWVIALLHEEKPSLGVMLIFLYLDGTSDNV